MNFIPTDQLLLIVGKLFSVSKMTLGILGRLFSFEIDTNVNILFTIMQFNKCTVIESQFRKHIHNSLVLEVDAALLDLFKEP